MKNERKEELKDEMKNKISMALKDPILQQGFEIICKENAILKGRTEGFEKQILGLLYKYESVYKRFPDLKDAMNKAERILKENKELKEYNKYLRRKRQGGIQKQYNKVAIIKQQDDQLTNAKEVIKKLIEAIHIWDYKNLEQVETEAEQFISEVEK